MVESNTKSQKSVSTSKDKEKIPKDDKRNRFKVTFIDKIDQNEPLVRTHYVLSFKKYNAMNTYDPMDGDQGQNGSHCCTVF